MNCQTYRDALTEAAVAGQAVAVPTTAYDAALRAHLDACAACRAELDRLTTLTSAIDTSLAQIASANPSPAFAARIRARIAEQADERASRWYTWAPAIAGAVAVVAVVAWLATRSAPGPRGPSRDTVATQTPTLAPPVANAEPDLMPAPPDKRIDIARHTPQPIRSPRPRRPAAKVSGSSLPEVLVTGDEWRQVAKLYVLAQKDEATAEALAPPDSIPLEEKFQPLVIAPMKPIKPLDTRPSDAQPE